MKNNEHEIDDMYDDMQYIEPEYKPKNKIKPLVKIKRVLCLACILEVLVCFGSSFIMPLASIEYDYKAKNSTGTAAAEYAEKADFCDKYAAPIGISSMAGVAGTVLISKALSDKISKEEDKAWARTFGRNDRS